MAFTPRQSRRSALALGVFALSVWAGEASADGPRYSSDGLYAGARVSPGVALFVLYDLDVYLDLARRYSLGPGIAATFFGAEADASQQQDYTVEIDPVRFKLQPGSGTDVRPYGLLAAGVLYGRFPTADDEYAATVTVGAGADFWIERNWALSILLQTRLRLSASSRLPVVWVELAIGARFGM